MNRRNKFLSWIIKYTLLWILLYPGLAFLFMNFFSEVNVLESTLFQIYFFLVSFTLPSLISKGIFEKPFIGLVATYSFLIYPLLFFLGRLTASIGLIDFRQFYFGAAMFVLALWNILMIKIVISYRFKKLITQVERLGFSLIPVVIFLIFFLILRDIGSIISTDILVHKTVLNGMENTGNFGLMPSAYSSTFTDQAYPIVMFHSFLYFIANSFSFDFSFTGYFVDLFLTILFSIAAFKLFRKYFTVELSVIGATLSVLVFENLAYSAHFFIPQTMAFLLFLFILTDKDLKLRGLIASCAILILTHFFIGFYLSFFLILKYIYFEKLLNLNERKSNAVMFKEASIILVFISLVSFLGFSLESAFQSQIVEWVGELSNPPFNQKIPALFNLIGAGWLLLIFSYIFVFLKKRKKMPEAIGYFGVLVCLSVYILAPVFAGKFLLGFGLFSSLLVISLLKQVKVEQSQIMYFVAVLLILSYFFNFFIQFENLTVFLQQNDGTESAVVEKDNELISYWQNENPDCVLLSDPQTQLAIHSLGKGETLRGNYMTLPDRNKLIDFINNPSDRTFNRIYEMDDLQVEPYNEMNICLNVSARLIELIEEDNLWRFSIFNYKVDHDDFLDLREDSIRFLEDEGLDRIYLDDYHAVYRI